MNLDDIRGSRWFLPAAAAAVLLVLVVLIAAISASGEDTGRLVATSVPDDLTLTLDGAKIAANGETVVKTGSHTLVASRPHFADRTQKFSIGKDQTYSISFYLDPTDAEGRGWYDDHPDQDLEREAVKGKEFEDTSKKIAAKYPVIGELPFIGKGFKVDYGKSEKHPNDPLVLAFYVKLLWPEAKKDALAWLKSEGLDPATTEIIWSASK